MTVQNSPNLDDNPAVSDAQPAAAGWIRVRTTVLWYLHQMWRRFFQHDCMAAAGALTYTTLFAVVPVMTVTYLILSLLPEAEDYRSLIEGFIFENFLPSSSNVVQEKLQEFANEASKLTMVGLFILFATSFMLLMTVERHFNTIWQVTDKRHGVQRFLLYWGVLSLGPLSVIAAVVSSIYLISLPLVSELDQFGLKELFLRYVPLLISTGCFTLIFYAVPNCHVPFWHAVAGGFVTMIVFNTALDVFAQLSRSFSYDAIYGTFAALPVFLLWLYLVWVIILCGAIFVRCLSLSRDPDGHREPLLIKAARVLKLLHSAHLDGHVLEERTIRSAVHLSEQDHDRVFTAFKKMRVITPTGEHAWILGRNLATLSLWDLYQQFPEGLEPAALKQVKDLPAVVEPVTAMARFGSNEMSISLDRVLSA